MGEGGGYMQYCKMMGIDYDVIVKFILETGQSKRKRRRKERLREPGIQGVKKVMMELHC